MEFLSAHVRILTGHPDIPTARPRIIAPSHNQLSVGLVTAYSPFPDSEAAPVLSPSIRPVSADRGPPPPRAQRDPLVSDDPAPPPRQTPRRQPLAPDVIGDGGGGAATLFQFSGER